MAGGRGALGPPAPLRTPVSISILILTFNEEVNLGACLESVGWSDDVLVLDSFSTDLTVQIARKHGVRVVQRRFDDYAAQRNFGLAQEYRNPWVLMLDADERVAPELRAEMLEATSSASPDIALFRMRRRDHLFGRWIKGASGYPTWFGRLTRVGRVRVERPINEEYHADGALQNLGSHLDHYPFNKGLSAWLAKHDRYSSLEAQLRLGGAAAELNWPDLLRHDATVRRRALKALAYRLPFRPVAIFMALYVLRGGILEGRAGLTFCVLRAWYEFVIDCKLIELQRRQRGQSI
jgi:glycosyltransferase involved in cell wall biosynthesis